MQEIKKLSSWLQSFNTETLACDFPTMGLALLFCLRKFQGHEGTSRDPGREMTDNAADGFTTT